jgi:hypothetical protein
MGARTGISRAIALVLASPAAAQADDGPAVPADPAGCEFHVWPGDGLMSAYYGWFHGGIINGAVQGRPGYPSVPPNPIDTATQSAILTQAEPQRLMAHADHRLIVHDEALTSRAIRTTPGRLTDSVSPCYAELVVDDVILQQDMINGASLKILFRYRDFGADALPRRSFATWAETDLAAFPPRQPDQLAAALADIRGAYRGNIQRFAAMALRPSRQRH